MLCGGLRAWFLAQSWLIAVLPSLVARRRVGLCGGAGMRLFVLVGWGFLSVAWPGGDRLVFLFCSGVSKLFCAQGSPSSDGLVNL